MSSNLIRAFVWLAGLSALIVAVLSLWNPEPELPKGEPLVVASDYFQRQIPADDVARLGLAGYFLEKPQMKEGQKVRVRAWYKPEKAPAGGEPLSADEAMGIMCPRSPEFWQRFDEAFTLEVYVSQWEEGSQWGNRKLLEIGSFACPRP